MSIFALEFLVINVEFGVSQQFHELLSRKARSKSRGEEDMGERLEELKAAEQKRYNFLWRK